MSNKVLKSNKEEKYEISSDGFEKLLQNRHEPDLSRNINWTDDFTVELPIRIGKDEASSLEPTTLIDEFRTTLSKWADRPALSKKVNGKWVNVNL